MGKFTKGRSGNPAGRPRGRPNRVTSALREAMLAAYEQMGGESALLRWAKASKTEFFKILLTRLMPPGAPTRLGKLEGAPADQARQVIAAMAAGTVTPEEASTVMQVIVAQTRVIEAGELARRIAAIEEKLNANAGPES